MNFLTFHVMHHARAHDSACEPNGVAHCCQCCAVCTVQLPLPSARRYRLQRGAIKPVISAHLKAAGCSINSNGEDVGTATLTARLCQRPSRCCSCRSFHSNYAYPSDFLYTKYLFNNIVTIIILSKCFRFKNVI